jgi:hypothetical protein
MYVFHTVPTINSKYFPYTTFADWSFLWTHNVFFVRYEANRYV